MHLKIYQKYLYLKDTLKGPTTLSNNDVQYSDTQHNNK